MKNIVDKEYLKKKIKIVGKSKTKNLFKKLLMPVVKSVKRSHYINIIDQNTAICPSVECDSKTLKSFLPSCVPYLHVTFRR